MHRIIRVPCFMLVTALFGLAVFQGLGNSRAYAQDKVAVVPVAINGSQSVEMSKKQRIKDIDNKEPQVATVDFYPGADFKKVMVKGGAIAGISRMVLTDVDGNKEAFDLVVELNVDYLRRVLAQAAPTANIQLVQGTGGTLILTGTVAQASDIAIVMQIASVAVGDSARVINALKIGGLQQVQLDVVIARVARSEARNLGLSWQENGAQLFLDSTVGGTGSLTSTLSSGLANVASTLSGTPNASWGVVGPQHAFLGFLEALRTENLVKVIAKPKVCTLTGQPAEFLSGGEQAVPVIASGSAGGGAVSGVDFKPFGTTIRFLPLVLGGGRIYLEVEPQFTFPDPSNLFSAPIPGTNSVVFGRDTQRVKTSAVLEDGQTMAIGGMIFHQVNGTASKVPVLGDIPFCGALFRTVNYSDSEEELLILITPHLVDAMSCDQVPKCLPGDETRKPDDFELFLEGILEAPRGHRCVWHDDIYVPAYKNSPTANMYPCPDWNGPRGAADLGFCHGPGCPSCCEGPYGGYPMGGAGPVMGGGPGPIMGGVGPVMGGMPGKDAPSANPPKALNQQSLAIPQSPPPVATYMQRQAAVETVPVETVPVTVAPLREPMVLQVNGSTSGVMLAAPTALEDPR